MLYRKQNLIDYLGIIPTIADASTTAQAKYEAFRRMAHKLISHGVDCMYLFDAYPSSANFDLVGEGIKDRIDEILTLPEECFF